MMMRLVFVSALMLALTIAAPARAIDVEIIETDSGVTAWLVEDRTNPIISVRFAWRGGAALDPAGKAGLASMVSGLLDEGAGDLDSQAFQGALEAGSIGLGFSAGKDTFRGELTMLTAKADDAWDLLHLAMTEPRFDEEPVERIRGQILAGLRQESQDPGTVAGLTLFNTLFPGHPYANPTRGSLDSVADISTPDLQAFVDQRLARENLMIGVVGDIDAETLEAALERVFSDLPRAPNGSAVDDVSPPTVGSLTVVEKAVPQSSILFAQAGPDRHDDDFIPLYVLNYVLGGGGFTSRLYTEVREARGLAYSVYSYVSPYEHTSIFFGGAGTSNARVGETVSVVRDEWAKMAASGISADELQDAKTYLTGSYPLRFTSSGRVADMLVGLQLDDFGPEYFDIRNGLIEAVTLKQVNEAAKRWLNPDSLTVVVVGQPEGLADGG